MSISDQIGVLNRFCTKSPQKLPSVLTEVRFVWLSGDTHLAIFRLSKFENSEVTKESGDSPAKPETDSPTKG